MTEPAPPPEEPAAAGGPADDEDDPPQDPHSRLVTGQAWLQFCARLASVGELLLGEDFPDDDRARAEGYRYLTRLLTHAIRTEMEGSDPDFPVFLRHEEPWSQWGGPNADNVYHRAAIDPALTYRVTVDATGVRQMLLSLAEGDMQLDEYGVYSERALDQLEVGDDGVLEVIVSPDEHSGNWMPTDPMARMVSIRQYQADWENDRVGVPTIELVGETPELPYPADPVDIAYGLDRASVWVERTLTYWSNYLAAALERATPNEMSAPRQVAGGADNIAYGSGFWDLGADDALVITCDEPDADYWNFQIHTLAWFESGAFTDRQTSLNMTQCHIDSDGRVRMVIAHRDPGVPNWIDTESRPVGLLAYRWVRAQTLPVPESEVVALADLADHLPADHPRVSAGERSEALRRRRRAGLARYA